MKRLSLLILFLAWLAFWALSPAFCGDAPREISVGVLFSDSGTMAPSERPLKEATLLAIRQINEAGGIFLPPERRLTLKPVLANGASNPAVFAREARQLVDHGVKVIFGCWTSDSRKAVSQAIGSRAGLLFYPMQFEGQEFSPWVVYSGLTANQQLFPAVDFLRQSFGPKLYLVGSDYVYPRTTHALCRSYLKRVGGQVVGESYRPRGAVDFDPIVRAMERSGCDAILNTINGDSQKAFLQACRQAGLNRPMIHLSLSESQAAAMGDLCQDHYLAWGYFSSLSTPQSLRFQRAYQTAYGADRVVDDPCQTAYFQVLAFARAVSVAGSAEPTLLRRAMKSLILDTPGGLVRYDPRNLYCWRTVRIARVTQGRAKVVWSSELPIKPEPDPRF